NLPRLRLSNDLMKAIIWIMRECGTPNVPGFGRLRNIQKRLTEASPVKPEKHTSALGNIFYMNNPAHLLSLDWANPGTREMIHVYPEIDSPIGEFRQAGKWANESPLEDLSPM
ncbi:hypothetical protein SISNIDRAFT_384270, partial [Sistotremastrum niveocremeum HHB9708]